MAYQYGTADNLLDLYETLVDFLTGAAEIDDGFPSYVGTGNGTLDNFRCLPGTPTETWTLTATSATNFTVTGSVSGAQAAATVGTPYSNAFVTFTITAGGTAFVTSDAFTIDVTKSTLETQGQAWERLGTFTVAEAPVRTGTGQGTMTSYSAKGSAPVETWTITATATPTIFTVVGSVSGAQANATQAIPYSNDYVSFTINDGNPDFITGDYFTMAVTEFGVALKGKGLSGTDEIFINFRWFKNTANGRYSLAFRGAQGYDPTGLYTSQPGGSSEVAIPTWDDPMPYWFYANGRRFIVFCKSSTVITSGYFGWILPFGLPAEYLFPTYVAGSMYDKDHAFDSASDTLRGFFDPNVNSAWLNTPDNSWLGIANKNYSEGGHIYVSNSWPWGGVYDLVGTIREGLDGESRMLVQGLLHSSENGGNVYGALDGVFFIPGFNALAPEHEYVDGGDTYKIFNSGHRLNPDDFVAIKEE